MEPIQVTDERNLLTGMVDRQRLAIAGLLDDLTKDEGRASLVPSLTTLLGLVKHATFVEQVWFHSRVAGVPRKELGLPDDIDASFRLDPDDTVESVRTHYLAACEHSRGTPATATYSASSSSPVATDGGELTTSRPSPPPAHSAAATRP